MYIQEAHPTDLWEISVNVRDGVVCHSPVSDEERVETANMCVSRLGIKIPALVDGIDNSVERAYTGWPDRLYLIGMDGRIRFKSAPGPYGFSIKDLEHALTSNLP